MRTNNEKCVRHYIRVLKNLTRAEIGNECYRLSVSRSLFRRSDFERSSETEYSDM